MNNKEFGKTLEKRTIEFAFNVFNLSSQLPNSKEFNVIKHQITKSATSVGANYREANRSRSIHDFINKVKICESEANETLYWLELIKLTYTKEDEKVQKLIIESNELIALFTSIVNKMKSKLKN